MYSICQQKLAAKCRGGMQNNPSSTVDGDHKTRFPIFWFYVKWQAITVRKANVQTHLDLNRALGYSRADCARAIGRAGWMLTREAPLRKTVQYSYVSWHGMASNDMWSSTTTQWGVEYTNCFHAGGSSQDVLQHDVTASANCLRHLRLLFLWATPQQRGHSFEESGRVRSRDR